MAWLSITWPTDESSVWITGPVLVTSTFCASDPTASCALICANWSIASVMPVC